MLHRPDKPPFDAKELELLLAVFECLSFSPSTWPNWSGGNYRSKGHWCCQDRWARSWSASWSRIAHSAQLI